jgi:hypothetical protein
MDVLEIHILVDDMKAITTQALKIFAVLAVGILCALRLRVKYVIRYVVLPTVQA